MSVVVSLSQSLMLLLALPLMGQSLHQAASSKRKFQPDNRNGCGKCKDSDDDDDDDDDDDWFLEFDKKGNDVYMKHCKVSIEPIAKSKDNKKCKKTDSKVVPVKRED